MAATTFMTMAEFAALPDEPGKQELLKGELLRVPPPKMRHGLLRSLLVKLLGAYARQHGGLRVFTNVGFRLSDDTCVEPDVALVNDAQLAGTRPDDWFSGAPALAIEILSPSNRATEIEDKVQAYLESGAAAVWVVNPLRRRVTAYSRGGRFEAFEMPEGAIVCEDLLPGLRIPLASVFA